MVRKQKLNPEQGKRLKECLKDRGMKQKELAELSNYTQQYVSKICQGKCSMTLESAEIFAKILKARKEYLLCKDDFKNNALKMLQEVEDIKSYRKCIDNIISELGIAFEYSGYDYWDIREKRKDHLNCFETLEKPKGSIYKEIIGIDSSGKRITLSSNDIERIYNDVYWFIKQRVLREFE